MYYEDEFNFGFEILIRSLIVTMFCITKIIDTIRLLRKM